MGQMRKMNYGSTPFDDGILGDKAIQNICDEFKKNRRY